MFHVEHSILVERPVSLRLMSYPELPSKIVAFDVETPNSKSDAICSIGLTLIDNGRITQNVEYRVNPDTYFDWYCIRVHGIQPEDAEMEPLFPEVWPSIKPLLEDRLLLAHNALFDLNVLKKVLYTYGLDLPDADYVDTVTLARRTYKEQIPNFKLNTVCDYLQIPLSHHQAGSDSFGCASIFLNAVSCNNQWNECVKHFSFYP